ncbi:hypothetical protein [Paenibacillus ehimensis]|uniref:Uncharacterized protein n=1 Tax=Paenibacillus ehimensis TaxID=79264 RepID=A0ABT8VMC4_9BACL|nr:hypothetical protein [Paenibacillus ehimensis]MDO3682116.1 hypothetical protein [Paenibacillus ehimensis]
MKEKRGGVKGEIVEKIEERRSKKLGGGWSKSDEGEIEERRGEKGYKRV